LHDRQREWQVDDEAGAQPALRADVDTPPQRGNLAAHHIHADAAAGNLRKAIIFILPTSSGQACIVVIAIVLGIALPITPVQILWVNMVTAITLSLSLAFEQPEAGVMRRPPRDPREPLLSGFLVWRIVLVSALMVAASLGLYLWEKAHGASLAEARTVAVNMLVAAEIFYLFNCRNLLASSLNLDGLLGNRIALAVIGVLALLQLAFTYAPLFQAIFGTAAIGAAAWMRIAAAAIAIMLLVEFEKWLARAWMVQRLGVVR